MELKGIHFIGNESSRKGDSFFYGVDPAGIAKLEPAYADATAEEINKAVEKAYNAFEVYRKVSPEKKARFLELIAEEILNLGDDLINRCMLETALTYDRLVGERTRTVNQLKLFAEVVREGSWVEARIDNAIPDRLPLPKKDIRQMQIPVGPVAVFGAGNFPLAFTVAGGDTASALAAGCTVVYKAHPGHPGTSEMLGFAMLNAVKKAGLPDGIFSTVHGVSSGVGMTIVNHPLIKAVGFTGSYKGGKALFDAAVRHPEPIPVYAEMGSTNPVFILPGAVDSRTKEIAEGLAGSFTLGVGQFCTNPGVVILSKSSKSNEFVDYLKKIIRGQSPGVMLSERMKSGFEKGIKNLETKEGIKLVSKGNDGSGVCEATTYLLKTTAEQFLNDDTLELEVFGPSTLIIQAEGKADLLKIAKRLHGHLTATIHCKDDNELSQYSGLADILKQKAGRLIINDFPTGVEVCHSMFHGGPFPATTDARFTSVGTAAIKRWVRPVSFQNYPEHLLPDELRNSNPLKIWRLIDGTWKK